MNCQLFRCDPIAFSDSTSDVGNAYDRRGRLQSVTNGTDVCDYSYNDAGGMLTESHTSGALNGLAITNAFDVYPRRTAVGLNTEASVLTQFGYDNAGRLESVTSGTHTAHYTYLANSPLISQIAFTNSGTRRMLTSKSHDDLNQLTAIASATNSSGLAAVSYAYGYNGANQRTVVTNVDNTYWSYQYDALGQLTSGKRRWLDGESGFGWYGTLVAGQQFEYTFDHIGNRTQTKSGGNAGGSQLRTAGYTNNTLNQLTSRAVPGYINVIGIALGTNTTVMVNSNTAYRKSEYFWSEVAVDNSATLWTNIIVEATTQTSVTGAVLMAESVESFLYDADGNLIRDGLWTNVWNAENRLVQTESLAAVPEAARMREKWSYLADGRWKERIVSTWAGGNYVPQYTNRFVWDGKVLLAVLDHTNGLVMTFVRGLDLSNSEQGAGGVGGMLAVKFKTNGMHFTAYDGNGNVTALVSASDGTVSARYEYDPFGQIVRITGPVSRLNPIRFSTQYASDVPDVVKFLYREFRPNTGGWLSRDAYGEKGGKNLYGFVDNDGISFWDDFGQQKHPIRPRPPRPPGPDPLPVPEGECRIQVCCRSVYGSVWEHCYVRSDGEGGTHGCRAGPSRDKGFASGSSGSQGGVPSHCRRCCGFWGSIYGGCGTPGSQEMAGDFERGGQACTTIAQGAAVCGLMDCVNQKMQNLNQQCVGYRTFGPNSNSAIFTALQECMGAAPQRPGGIEVPGWEPITPNDRNCQ